MQRVSFDRVDFFLGATTPAGFKGYFEPLRREPGMQMVLIKSGPGCGKSTLMKQLARRAIQQGEPVECIHCASDPDSFDGVIFVRQRRAIVDATAPHTIEPDAPGADEVVLSLYHTIQADALRPHAEEVKALFARNAALRARAVSALQWLAAPPELPVPDCPVLWAASAIQTISASAAQTAAALPELGALHAKSAALYAANGQELYVSNADEKLQPASVTKIMTMLLAMEALERGEVTLDTMITGSEHACSMGGTQIWLEPGERLTLDEMLKAIAVGSANDCAVAVAEHLAGTEAAVVERMNARARELGCTGTTFINANGLDGEGESRYFA